MERSVFKTWANPIFVRKSRMGPGHCFCRPSTFSGMRRGRSKASNSSSCPPWSQHLGSPPCITKPQWMKCLQSLVAACCCYLQILLYSVWNVSVVFNVASHQSKIKKKVKPQVLQNPSTKKPIFGMQTSINHAPAAGLIDDSRQGQFITQIAKGVQEVVGLPNPKQSADLRIADIFFWKYGKNWCKILKLQLPIWINVFHVAGRCQ